MTPKYTMYHPDITFKYGTFNLSKKEKMDSSDNRVKAFAFAELIINAMC